MRVNAGDYVRLGQIPDEPDNPIREKGVVLSRDEMPWGISLCIRVDAEFLTDPTDDGLRECTEDQVEEVIHVAD